MRAGSRARASSAALLAGLVVASALGCGGDIVPRLEKPLSGQGIKDVTVDDKNVTATCAQGDKVEVPVTELSLNFLGMAKTEKVANVVKTIVETCETKDKEKRRAEAIKAAQGEEAKRLGIDVTGKDDEAIRLAICDKLTAQLPVKEPDRTKEGEANKRSWGCADPPAAESLPTGLWQIELGQAKGKKPATHFLRLENDDGEKLTVRCTGSKADLYVQVTKKVKKGTKAVDVKVDGKGAKWKVKLSTDGKAIFLADVKGAGRSMAGAERLTLAVPAAKGQNAVTFTVKGFGEAQKQLPKGCR